MEGEEEELFSSKWHPAGDKIIIANDQLANNILIVDGLLERLLLPLDWQKD